jgi:hypothetical protein
MERFVSEQSVRRYRQLASGTLTATERKAVFASLSEQEAKYRDCRKLKIPLQRCPDSP